MLSRLARDGEPRQVGYCATFKSPGRKWSGFVCPERGGQRTKTGALTFTSRARTVLLNTQLRCHGSTAAVVLPSFSQSDDRS
jgi:hypothetical protein